MSQSDAPKRLDIQLVEAGLVATRSRARDLIVRGLVAVDGAPVTKPAASVGANARLSVAAEVEDVSRGAVKLRAALAGFAFSPQDRICLDIGASTGGFTQVLLSGGASKVYAVDVGHGQLAAELKSDPRVINLEGTDARALTHAVVPEPVQGLVADVSFISVMKALGVPLGLAAPGAWLVALIKPQFEVGPGGVGKGGIVSDAGLREAAVARVRGWVETLPGWHVVDVMSSPIAGGSGNVEFLLGARRDG